MNNLFLYFKFFSKKLGSKLFLLFILAFFASLLEVVGVSFFIPILSGLESDTQINYYLSKLFSYFDINYSLNNILITIVLCISLRSLLLITEGILRGRILANLLINLRNEVSTRLFKLKYLDFINYSSGFLNNAVITEIQKLVFSLKMLISLVILFIFSISYIILPIFIEPLIVVVPIGFVILIYPFIIKLNNQTKSISSEATRLSGKVQSILLESLRSFKYLKSTRNNKKINLKLKSLNKELGDKQYAESFLQSMSNFIFEPLLVLIVATCIYFIVTVKGQNVSEIIILIAMVINSLRKLLGMQQNTRKMLNSWGSINIVDKLFEELNVKQEILINNHSTNNSIKENISFQNVSFYYEEGNNILKNISFNIKQGSSVAFVGESGSGKSTIANLIIGLLHQTDGIIYYGDQKNTEFNLNEFRSSVGYITQENVIFNDTIKNNITLWNDINHLSNQKLIEASKNANIYEFIDSLPKKFDTVLGESGLNISGGQRQRICIAREFFRNNKLIIFDEATSSLDNNNEKIIQESITLNGKNKTIVIIAHRLSSVKDCDEIFLIRKGEIVEKGNFKDLINSKGYFYQMYKLQEEQKS